MPPQTSVAAPAASYHVSTRPTLARIFAVAVMLMESNRHTSTTLARELEVSTKTILRDIEFMRDRLGIEIEYCRVEEGLCADWGYRARNVKVLLPLVDTLAKFI